MEGLLVYKYRLHGSGQVTAEYGEGGRAFTHVDVPFVKGSRAPRLDQRPQAMLPSRVDAMGSLDKLSVLAGAVGATTLCLLCIIARRGLESG